LLAHFAHLYPQNMQPDYRSQTLHTYFQNTLLFDIMENQRGIADQQRVREAARLRATPGLNGHILTTVPAGTHLTAIGRAPG
jgi:hypothetical protein